MIVAQLQLDLADFGDGRLPHRFWEKVIRVDTEVLPDCWVWTGTRNQAGIGYGRWKVGGHNGRMLLTHRSTYETLVGPVPRRLELDHLCRNKPCCNPAHLQPVTRRINTKRHFILQETCKQGHPLAGDNLYIDNRDHRCCRACKAEWSERKKAKLRAATAARRSARLAARRIAA